jgi:DNA methylase
MPTSALKIVRNKSVPIIDPEFQSLIAPLTPEERCQLETNLAAEGCRDPLVVWNGILLDGHNRLEICTRLRIPYKVVEVELPNREAARLWIELNQVGRRNLTPDQRAAIAFRILQRRVAMSKVQRARKGGLAGGIGRPKIVSLVAPSSTKQTAPRQREIAAAQLGVASRKIRSVSEIAKQSVPMLEQIVAGTLTIREAKDQLLEEGRRTKREAALKTNPRGSQIHTGDLSLLEHLVADSSADLFLTDPPYEKSAMPLYGRLAELAQRKLKRGGLCAVMCGQLFFDRIFQEMGKHLDYYWLCGIAGNSGARSSRILNRRMLNVLRLVVIFSNRPLKQMAMSSLPIMLDLIPGERDKLHHSWGQGLKQLQYLVEHLSEPGQLVVDPFVGGGTVPVACVSTGRRYIATEIDPGVAAAARARVAEFRKSNKGR